MSTELCLYNWSSFEQCNLGTRWKLKVVDTARAISAHLRHSLDFGRTWRLVLVSLHNIYDSKIITNWIFFSFFLRLFLQNIEYSVWNYSHLEDDELGRVPFLLSNLKVLENLNELDEMNLRTGSAIHWTVYVSRESLYFDYEYRAMFPRNRGKILNICYRIFHYIHSSKELCRAKRMIDRRAFKHLIFLFFFLANIDLVEKFIQTKLANYSSFWFDKSYDKSISNRFWEKREERDRGKFIVLPCFESVNETHVSPKFSSLGERKKERRGAREDNNKEGEGRVNRGWSIYCTTVGQRIDFTPRRFAPFFPSTTPLVSEKKKEREKGNLSEKEIEKFVRDSKEERSPFPLNFN